MNQIFKYDCHEPAYRQADARINTNIKLLKPISAHSCIRGKKILHEGEQACVVQ